MTDADVLYRHVIDTIGPSPSGWPGGWPDEIEAALIDAVFSVRARYGNRDRESGVYGAVARYRRSRGGHADDLSALAALDETELIERLKNKGKIAGRTKAQIVIDAAHALTVVKVVHARDFDTRQDEAQAAYLSVKGCGQVTWQYFRMLLGHDDVKPDTWVMRYVQGQLPQIKSTAAVAEVVSAVADRLGASKTDLDHAIWQTARKTLG